jgi:hypothetical protein
VPARTGLAQPRLDDGDLAEPLGTVRGSPVVPAIAQEPLIVFTGAGAVIGQLLGDELGLVHDGLQSQYSSTV